MERIKEIYNYRQMIFRLVRKDLRGRYKGSAGIFLDIFKSAAPASGVYNGIFRYYAFRN